LVLMEEKGFTRHDYGLRHHGGYLAAIMQRFDGYAAHGSAHA